MAGSTTSIIFWRMLEHMVLKVAAVVMAFIVTLSAPKTALSASLPEEAASAPDRGSVLGPLTYRVAIALSNTNELSNSWKSSGADPGATMLGKFPACTPPKVCPQAVI